MKTLVTLGLGAIGGLFMFGVYLGYVSQVDDCVYVVDCDNGARFVKKTAIKPIEDE